GHITPRQPNDFFRKKFLVLLWQGDGIGNDVVNEVCAHGRRISEKAHLHRGGPVRENSRPAIGGDAHEIYRDIDLPLMQQRCDVRITHAPYIDEMLHRLADPLPASTAVILAKGKAERLE